MVRGYERRAGEPDVWFFVFCERTESAPGHWYVLGRFRHVWAFAWVAGAWIIYDVADHRTGIRILVDGPAAMAELADLRAGETTLCIAPRARSMPLRLGFWCVPAMAHLAGVGRCAVRPDGFYRDLIRAGAEIVDGGILGQSGTATRQAEIARQTEIKAQQDSVDKARALSLQDDLGQQTNQLARMYGSNGIRNTLSTAPLVGGMVR